MIFFSVNVIIFHNFLGSNKNENWGFYFFISKPCIKYSKSRLEFRNLPTGMNLMINRMNDMEKSIILER